jgi:hypothetical protein
MSRRAMDGSERELRARTADLEAMHHDLLPGFRGALGEAAEAYRGTVEAAAAERRRRSSRRNFLRGGLVTAGALGGGLLVSGCGGSKAPGSVTRSATVSTTSAAGGDLAVARLAAALEVVAVNAYDGVLAAASRQQLGTVPPAIATFVTTVRAQHADHQSAWNSILVGAGRPAQTGPDPRYQAMVARTLASLTDVAGAARLALQLETVAMETYTAGATALTEARNRRVALSIAPVEAQHVAILQFVLGSQPAPDAVIGTDRAASTGDL